MDRYQVLYYEDEKGFSPIEMFFAKLTEKQRSKTYRDIELLSLYGNFLREPQSKYIRNGIYELRTKQGSDISRILYFFFVGKKIILTNGFMKKTQKLPERELKLAIKYKEEFIKRGKYHENV